jgi:hypothetical protein
LAGWLLQKLGGVMLIAGLGLAAYGVWLFLQDDFDFGTQKPQLLARLEHRQAELLADRDELDRRLADLWAESVAGQLRLQQVERVQASLRAASGWGQRLFGNRAQQRANAERRVHLDELRDEAQAHLAEVQQQITAATRTKVSLDAARDKLERRLAEVQQSGSRTVHYLRVAWDDARWYLAAWLAGWFLLPPFGRLGLFYFVAPFVARRRPIRFSEAMAARPEAGEPGVAIETGLWPGEALRVKGSYLQTFDDGLTQGTRWLLDWRHPVTSVACGLVGLVEMRHPHAGDALRVTFGSPANPPTELALVDVPEGSSLILRPSYLVGVIERAGQRLVIRRRWAWWRWPAWVTRQLRFFEFVGPCRLIVGGPRGVRIESLVAREEQPAPTRRTSRGATIGFTPNLDYRPARTDSFWNYFRGRTPLFDGLFSGPGFFLRQEAARGPVNRPAGPIWTRAWNAGLRVFGL